MPGGDLRLPPLVHVAANPCVLNAPLLRAFGFQTIQSSVIDGLERQAVLKPFDGRSVELAGSFERALPIELNAVALETDSSWFTARGWRFGARSTSLAGEAS
jgi:hypothetical protein